MFIKSHESTKMTTITVCLTIATVFGNLINSSEGKWHFGFCPKYSAVRNFNTTLFAGSWHGVESQGFFTDAIGSRCDKVSFNEPTGSKNSLNGTYTTEFGFGGVQAEVAFHFVADNERYGEEGKLQIRTKEAPGTENHFFNRVLKNPVSILNVDYNNYAVLWTCMEFPFINYRVVWVLSRSGYLDETSNLNVNSALQRYGINPKDLLKVDQKICNQRRVLGINLSINRYVAEI